MLREKFTTLNVCVRKKESFKINDLIRSGKRRTKLKPKLNERNKKNK